MAEKQWKPGSKVKLASGGPEMTVRLTKFDGDQQAFIVLCNWFDNNQNLHEKGFTPDSLVATEGSQQA
jgi:uncharacterized protein YodC (DUF2158 family)